ncbi:unnamed protein product [Sphagnum balticum]
MRTFGRPSAGALARVHTYCISSRPSRAHRNVCLFTVVSCVHCIVIGHLEHLLLDTPCCNNHPPIMCRERRRMFCALARRTARSPTPSRASRQRISRTLGRVD